MELIILTPAGEYYRGGADRVSLPGVAGRFTVLPGHAALMTALEAGEIRYMAAGAEAVVAVKSGFVEINRNRVSVCAEL